MYFRNKKIIAIEMDMPSACLTCPINSSDMNCVVTNNKTFADIMRPRWCPLLEICVDENGDIHIDDK